MLNNDQILLDQIVEEQRISRTPAASKSEFFELYVSEQVLKDHDLTDEEIETGLVGGGNDGGVDAIYTFANGELVLDDFDHGVLKKNILLEVVIIQSKTSAGYDEATIHRLIAVTRDLFALASPLDDYAGVYCDALRSSVGRFRSLYKAVAGRFPTLMLRYVYAARGDGSAVHPNVRRKSKDLESTVRELFPNASFDFSFYGAAQLLALARRQPTTSFEMQFVESLTGQHGYIALVRLKDFVRFIRTESGQLRKTLFEANVRDYQGNTQVNEGIQRSLVEGGPEDFWWLNNGVTIVASKALQGGKVLTMEDPQIVNGQQTSTEIFSYFGQRNPADDERCVMVRVIVATNPTSRDRIIKATNSQTTIPPASLRATEKIHRDIEDFLAPFSLYYDRRKNSQKQQGRPTDSIVSIGLMAQALMSIVLQRPDEARARPSSLIKKDDDYARIFNDKFDISVYLITAKIVKTAHAFLRSQEQVPPEHRANLLFYVAMYASATLTGSATPSVKQLAAVNPEAITYQVMSNAMGVVRVLYLELGGNDQVAKGPELLRHLKDVMFGDYPPPHLGRSTDHH
jgi:hypothetical protein